MTSRPPTRLHPQPRSRSSYKENVHWDAFGQPESLHYRDQEESSVIFSLSDPYDLKFRKYDGEAWVSNALDQTARQLYSHFLFRMPSMYYSRVVKVFCNSQIKHEDLEKLKKVGEMDDTEVTPTLMLFRIFWCEFVDTLIEEWKTLNLISALLLS